MPDSLQYTGPHQCRHAIYLVKLRDGREVEEDAAVLNLDWEGQELHVIVLHVVQALTAASCGQSGTGKLSATSTHE